MKRVIGWSLVAVIVVVTTVWMLSLSCLLFPSSWGLELLPLEWFGKDTPLYPLNQLITIAVVANGLSGIGFDLIEKHFFDAE